jgi:Peptidase family M23/Chitinase class I
VRAASNSVAGARRSIRWSAALVAGAVVMGGVATTAAAQPPPAPEPTPAEPPPDNVFPVPLPHEVAFSDSWHACRDDCSRQHKGNDLMAAEGTPAVAVEAGVIAKVDNTDDGLGGLTVWLVGDSGVAYYYAHNSQNLVVEGQRVGRGQMIAQVGHTGNARTTPPHIHFQINLCGELSSDEPCTVDPYPYLQSWAQGLVDGGADGVGWYQPSTGAFGQRTEAGSPLPSFPFGTAGATDVVPLAGDWDGDGRDSVGIYQRADATFRLRDDEGAVLDPLPFGEPGRSDVWPVAGDFDGDGRDTVGLYRQADAAFVVLVDLGVESSPVTVGTPGRPDAMPVVGDWDGDGRDSIGVYRQADASVSRLDDDGAALEPLTAGASGPQAFPVAGDWDGDGRDDIGVLRRDAAAFDLPIPNVLDPTAVRTVPIEGGADVLPVAGDWNGRDLITLEELRQIYGLIPDEPKVIEGLPALNAAMLRAGISTPARKAAFLATLRSESGFRYDAVEGGSNRRYRGRGFIQLTGDFNYRAAGEFLGLDLVGDPDLAINGLASPAIAAWYWTVARDINRAADALDMAAVNIAIGFAPSVRRDTLRCGDFLAALRYYSGGTVPDGVNCERTVASRLLAFASVLPLGRGSSGAGAPSGAVTLPPTSIPEGWVPSSPGTTAPADPATLPPGTRDPAAPTAPPTSSTTAPVPPTRGSPSTGTPSTATPTTAAPTTGTPTTGAPTTSAPSTTSSTTATSSTAAPGSTTTLADGTTTTSSPGPGSTTTTSVDPDGSTTTTLFDGS